MNLENEVPELVLQDSAHQRRIRLTNDEPELAGAFPFLCSLGLVWAGSMGSHVDSLELGDKNRR